MEVDAAPPSAAATTLVAIADKTEKLEKLSKKEKVPEGPLAALPEADIYISLLVVIWLVDQKKYAEVRTRRGGCSGRHATLTGFAFWKQGKELTTALIATISSLNRRTMDQLASKAYFYWVRLHELSGDDTAALRT